MFRKLDFIVPIRIIPQITIPNYIYIRELLVIVNEANLLPTPIPAPANGEGDKSIKAKATINKDILTNKIIKITEPTTIKELEFLNSAFNGSYNRISYLVVSSLNDLTAELQTEIQKNYFALLFVGFKQDAVKSKEIANFTGTKGVLIDKSEVQDYVATRNVHGFVDSVGNTAIKFYAEYLSNAVLQPRNYAEVSGDIFKSASSVAEAELYFTKRLNWVSDADMISIDGGFCGNEEFYAPYIKEEVRVFIQKQVALKIAQGVENSPLGEAVLEIVTQNALNKYTETNNWLDATNSQVISVLQDTNDKFTVLTTLSLAIKNTYKRNIITAYEV